MRHIIPDASSLDVRWRKASASSGDGNCVELAPYLDGVVIRHSKAPDGPAFLFSRSEIAAMVAGARAGEFDDLT
jgi:hypothetical protein